MPKEEGKTIEEDKIQIEIPSSHSQNHHPCAHKIEGENQKEGDHYHNQIQIKRRQQQANERKQLTSIFTELVSIINMQSKMLEKLSTGSRVNTYKQPIQSQLILSGRLQNKRKTSKLSKSVNLNQKQLEGFKILAPKKQTPFVAFAQLNPEIEKRKFVQIDETNNKIKEASNALFLERKKLYENYERYMTYCIHESEDEAEIELKPPIKTQKIKTLQISLSEHSFAHSSRKTENSRKFSIQRSVELFVAKPSGQQTEVPKRRNYQIIPQFQWRHSNRELTLINFQHMGSPRSKYKSGKDVQDPFNK